MTSTIQTTDTGNFPRRLEALRDAAGRGLLAQGARGIEKESLRIRGDGSLAASAHPPVLGSALTHPELTTDYSEVLLEFITPPVHDPVDALQSLERLHGFVHRSLGEELLWDASMPGALPPDAKIPIAHYGTSNQGRFKHIYRKGLDLRYGRAMQCIAGIHYNFSLPEKLWPLLLEATQGDAVALSARPAPDDIASSGYMGLIRNYRRFSWLLLLLFGASPAMDRSFFRDRDACNGCPDTLHGLDVLDPQTLYLPYATSLRMSDLGYHNRASSEVRDIDLRSLRGYLSSVDAAINAPYAPYAAWGTHRDGEWIQLNTNLLQIENELYATIRPKRVLEPGERIVHALARRGIQYIEVRCLDIDPFERIGIGQQTVRFLDAFLTMCVMEDSPVDTALQSEADANFHAVARDGRRPGKTLTRGGETVELRVWAEALLVRIEAAARVLDASRGDGAHLAAVLAQRTRIAHPEQLPSARVLEASRAAGSFAQFALAQSREHAAHFRQAPLDDAERERLSRLAVDSIARQAAQEAADTVDFDTFVAQVSVDTPGLLDA